MSEKASNSSEDKAKSTNAEEQQEKVQSQSNNPLQNEDTQPAGYESGDIKTPEKDSVNPESKE